MNEVIKFDRQGEAKFHGQQLLELLPKNGFNKVTRAWIRNELTKGNDFERAKEQITKEYDDHARYNLKTVIRDNIDKFINRKVNQGNEEINKLERELNSYTSNTHNEIRETLERKRTNARYYRSVTRDEIEQEWTPEQKEHLGGLRSKVVTAQTKYRESFNGFSLKTKVDKMFDNTQIHQGTIKSYPSLNDILVWHFDADVIVEHKNEFSMSNGDSFRGYYLCAVEIMDNANIIYEDLEVYAHDVIPERVVKSINKAKSLGAQEFLIAYPRFDFTSVSEKEIIRQDDLRRANTQGQQNDTPPDQETMLDPIVVAVSGETLFYVDKWE